MNRNMLNHSQVGQGIGMSGRTNSMGSSGLGSPNRSSPSIICMPKQQPARQPFTINRLMHSAEVTYLLIHDTSLYRSVSVWCHLHLQIESMKVNLLLNFNFCSMSGFGMNRNQAFGMNNSLSSNIFNGTGQCLSPWWFLAFTTMTIVSLEERSIKMTDIFCEQFVEVKSNR